MLLLIVLMACFVVPAFAQGPRRFEVKQFERKKASCVITFEYPEIISAASPQARDRINAGILRVLLRRTDWPPSDSGFRSLDTYADNMVSSCQEDQRPLYEHKRVTIFRYTPPILSFRCDADADLGGVHPYGTTLFANFESSTGNTVVLTDLLKEDDLGKLEAVAESIFRQERMLPPTAKLSEQSYSFPGDRFKLNDNFGVGERELVFIFNTYEIAPGAAGQTQITMPLQLIRWLFKPGLRLW